MNYDLQVIIYYILQFPKINPTDASSSDEFRTVSIAQLWGRCHLTIFLSKKQILSSFLRDVV